MTQDRGQDEQQQRTSRQPHDGQPPRPPPGNGTTAGGATASVSGPGLVVRPSARLHCSVRSLSLFSLLFGLVATGALSLAVATDFWIYTEEPVVFNLGNESDIGGGGGGGAVPGDQSLAASSVNILNVRMHSGLWRLCIIHGEAEDGVPPEVCYNIEYFKQEWGRLDDTDTTNSILRAIRKASPVIVGSLLLLLTALTLSILGNSKGDFKTIVSAIVYIFSALCLALGVIIYISAVNDEVAHRKKTETSAGDQAFSYRYGWAFFFGAATFMCAMVAAVSNISLHLRRLSAAADEAAAAGDELSQPRPPSASSSAAFTVPGYRPVQPSRTQEVVAEHEVTTMNNVTIIL